ncbi:MAG TPA: IclR family transcriptional regulator [Nevskia sp.]|nr:IclR family transcriptional regulator [Nevskia sp.]
MAKTTAKKTASAPERVEEDISGGPRALFRVLRILDSLAASGESASLAALSAQMGSPKSSLLNLLRPLVADGYLTMDGGYYRLGARSFRLAARILSRWSFPGLIQGQMEELWRRTGETVSLAVLDQDAARVTYISVIESQQPVRYAMQVGISAHLYCTAAGRMLLAVAEPAWQERYLKNVTLKAYTPRTVTSVKKLRELLRGIRDQGWSVSIGESMPNSGALAAPVLGPRGEVLGALTIGAPSERLEARQDELRVALLETAAKASGLAQPAA